MSPRPGHLPGPTTGCSRQSGKRRRRVRFAPLRLEGNKTFLLRRSSWRISRVGKPRLREALATQTASVAFAAGDGAGAGIIAAQGQTVVNAEFQAPNDDLPLGEVD